MIFVLEARRPGDRRCHIVPHVGSSYVFPHSPRREQNLQISWVISRYIFLSSLNCKQDTRRLLDWPTLQEAVVLPFAPEPIRCCTILSRIAAMFLRPFCHFVWRDDRLNRTFPLPQAACAMTDVVCTFCLWSIHSIPFRVTLRLHRIGILSAFIASRSPSPDCFDFQN
jgi:hypothetical protein